MGAQAVAIEKKARELEASGRNEDAFREYKSALEVYKFVFKWENNPSVKQQVKDRLEEVLERSVSMKKKLDSGVLPPVQPMTVSHGTAHGATGVLPPPPATQEDDQEDKEHARMRKGLESAIVHEKPNIKWDDVAGLKAAKDALQETVLLPKKFPQLFTGKREPWKAILLYGPPGTGKTHLARACATEADATFFSISSSDLVSKWMGESERLVRNLFEMARENKPSIVFIDEVDSLCGARGESGESDAARRIKTEFLAQMDGVTKTSSDDVLILGATNTPWDLDTAIRRRFEKRIYIPLPDAESRLRMLDINLGDTVCALTEVERESIAERTDGLSAADIGILVRDAIFEPVRKCTRARAFHRVARVGDDGVIRQFWMPCSPGHPEAVEMMLKEVQGHELIPPDVIMQDFESALDKTRASVGPEDLTRHIEWTQVYGMDGSA